MTTDRTALARRAVALPGWRWLPGMLDAEGLPGLVVSGDGVPVEWTQQGRTLHQVVHGTPAQCRSVWLGRVPDLDDPATAGCLLELLGDTPGVWLLGQTLGEVCVVAAAAKGRWGD